MGDIDFDDEYLREIEEALGDWLECGMCGNLYPPNLAPNECPRCWREAHSQPPGDG